MLNRTRQLLSHSSGLVYSQHHPGVREWAQYTGKIDHPFSGSYVSFILARSVAEINTSRTAYSLRLSILQAKVGLMAQAWTGQGEWFVTGGVLFPSF